MRESYKHKERNDSSQQIPVPQMLRLEPVNALTTVKDPNEWKRLCQQ